MQDLYYDTHMRQGEHGRSLSGRSVGSGALLCLACMALLFHVCGTRSPELSPGYESEVVNAPLSDFRQQLTSPVHYLSMKASERKWIPVTIKNVTNRLWSSAGRYPVLLSYRWSDRGLPVAIDGERSPLPQPIKPGEEITAYALVLAPSSGKDLVLNLSLVQEGVAWFFVSGGTPLLIPVSLGP